MTDRDPPQSFVHYKGSGHAVRDLWVVAAIFIGALVAADHVDFIEKITTFNRTNPQYHIDNLVTAMTVGFVAMGWYGWRRWRSVSRDATKLRQLARDLATARDAAETANRVKSEFLATMSHELRTPLNAIIGFSDLMASSAFGSLGAPEYEEFVRDISWSANHLLSAVNDVLDMSKIESGHFALKLVDCNLDEILLHVSQLMMPLAEKAQLELAIQAMGSAGEPSLTFKADKTALRRLMLNLVSNAIKFTPPGGRVSVGCVQKSDALEFYVLDTGIGMSPNEIELALQPFRQVDGSLARRYEGVGLGLPIVKAIVAQHHGNITIESIPGKGTRVAITLPMGLA